MPTRFLPVFAAFTLAVPALAQSPGAPPANPAKPAEPANKPEPKPPATLTKAPDPTLKLGDKAPALSGTTIKGDPLPNFESNKVYVIDFWATWCPSCRESLPKLKKLAKNKDLSIIAIASSEKSPDKGAPDKRLEGVQHFANDHEMPYTVVFDGTRTIANDWMVAAHPGLPRYLPFSFVVDSTGTITWIGDPRKPEFDAAIEKALKPLAPPPAQPTPTDAKKPDKKPKTKPKTP
jgi:thiol-disulfide isomerase/thioredoxin